MILIIPRSLQDIVSVASWHIMAICVAVTYSDNVSVKFCTSFKIKTQVNLGNKTGINSNLTVLQIALVQDVVYFYFKIIRLEIRGQESIL